MSENTDAIRYCVGRESDLYGMSREEVEKAAYEFLCEAEDAFAELIDDVYGDVSIAGMEYTASRALRAVDPIAWRCLLADEIAEIDLNDYPSEDLDEE